MPNKVDYKTCINLIEISPSQPNLTYKEAIIRQFILKSDLRYTRAWPRRTVTHDFVDIESPQLKA